MVGDDAVGSSSITLISYHVSRWACPPANNYNSPRTASPAAMTTKMYDTPIGLHDTHTGRDMNIMPAYQRSSYINTVVSA